MLTRNVAILLVIAFVTTVRADIFDECNAISDRTFISSNTSCSHYIFCDGENSFEGECGQDEYFNEKYQTCDPKDLVDCPAHILNASSATPPVPTLPPLTTASTNMATPFNITAPEFTNLTTAATTATTHIPPPNNTQPNNVTSTINSNSTNHTTPIPPPIANTSTHSPPPTKPTFIMAAQCPDLDNPDQMVFVAHAKSCSDYFICYHGEALPMHCSAMLHFNVNTGKCDYPQNVRCRTDFTKPKEQCRAHTVDLYPHSGNCNYFYHCRNGYLLLQQCPFYYGWDFEKRTCVALSQAKCYNQRQQL